jgi:hypothetical protein
LLRKAMENPAITTPPRQPRSKWKVVMLLAVGLVVWELTYGESALSFNMRNKGVARKVLCALSEYHKKNGHYPPTIDALTPEFLLRPLALVPGTSLYYAVSPARDRFWLALVPWKNYVLPTERAYEFESGMGIAGEVRDLNELTAKDVGIRRHLPTQ